MIDSPICTNCEGDPDLYFKISGKHCSSCKGTGVIQDE